APGEVSSTPGGVRSAPGEAPSASGEVSSASDEAHSAAGGVRSASGEVSSASGAVSSASGAVSSASGAVSSALGEARSGSRDVSAAAERPPPRNLETSRLTGVRKPLTSFIGRDEDVTRVLKMLAEGRLVTLTGPGGAGKTRLAIETA